MIPNGPCCPTCPHAKHGAKFVPPSGTGASGILIVGDSPWKDEQRELRPFAGAAGHTLDRWFSLLSAGGMKRDDVTIFNTIQCPPLHLGWMDYPGRYPASVDAIEHCRPHLDELIVSRKPRVIVPLGNVALRRVCGLSGIEENSGYVLRTPYGIPAVPGPHPSYLMRGKSKLTPLALWVLVKALRIAQGEYKESEYELLIDPPVAEVKAYIASGRGADGRIRSLFVDVETPESARLDEEELESEGPSFTILRCGFSVRSLSACTVPWAEPYISALRPAFESADEFVEWADNRYDSRRLAAAGMPIPRRIVSGMWAWHWLQSDLRKGLAYVAPFFYNGPSWKHLSAAEPARYNALDVAVGLSCYEGIRKQLGAITC